MGIDRLLIDSLVEFTASGTDARSY